MSGEIKGAYPDKIVTLVHMDRLPLNDNYPDNFRDKIVAALEVRKINILLSEKADFTSSSKTGPVKLESGKVLPADLVVFAF
jgi:hypothetical protein